MTNHFSQNVSRQKMKIFQSIQRLSQLSRDLFTTNSFSRKFLSFSGHSRNCIATISLLPNLQNSRVFSFIRQMWQVFKTLSFPSLRLSWTPLNTNHFSLKPHHSQAYFLHFQLQGMPSKTFSSCLSEIMWKFKLGY